MSNEAPVCQFIFTMKEYRRSLAGYWRMCRWWYLGVALFLFAIPTYGLIFPDPSVAGIPPQALIYNFLPPAFLIIFLGLFSYWQMCRVFKKGLSYNREIIYTLRDNGAHVVTPLALAEYSWQSFAHAGETRHGFYIFLLGKRSYHWLPKSGFVSPGEADHCRALLRQKIRKFQPLS